MIRRICTYCTRPQEPSEEELQAYREEVGEGEAEIYGGMGCNFCSQTGFLGRTGVFELLPFSDTIRQMLQDSAGISDIKRQALNEGMIKMGTDGMLKVKQGITTPAEILRSIYSIT